MDRDNSQKYDATADEIAGTQVERLGGGAGGRQSVQPFCIGSDASLQQHVDQFEPVPLLVALVH